MIGRSTLARMTVKFLLNEYVLPSSHQSLFRRMLANVNSPEISVAVGRELIDALLYDATVPSKTERAQHKQLMRALRGIRTSLAVLNVWAKKEENVSAPYEISEYAVLAVWAKFQNQLKGNDPQTNAEISALISQQMSAGETYHSKLAPYYQTDSAFGHALPNSVLISERVFEEIGRLGLMGYVSSFYAFQSENLGFAVHADYCGARLEALLETHTCSRSPIHDYQANDIFLGVLCLVATKREQIAKNWLWCGPP